MSFSVAAAGTKEQALSSLAKANVNDNVVGVAAVAFATDLLKNDNSVSPSETQDIRYSVNVSGHSGEKSMTSLNISFSAQLYPKPE
jgi:hypothetical protein